MMTHPAETEELLCRAKEGDAEAFNRLLCCHRLRLRRMIAVRLDPLLAARIDPSDVVQETIAEAARKLPRYCTERRLPFYPWLRELAWEQLARLYRRHVKTQRRSVLREQGDAVAISHESVAELVQQVAASSLSPSGRLMRKEVQDRVHAALQMLSPQDREILVMRHLEQLEVAEIAVILQISEKAVMMRRLRAFEHLRRLLGADHAEAPP